MIKLTKASLALSMLFASTANATGGAYIGVDFAFANDTELQFDGISISDSNDPGINLVGGYAFAPSENFKIGVEAEFRTMGDVTYLGVLKSSGSAFYLNAKPMFFFNKNIYIAGLLGMGQMELEVKDIESGVSASESDTSFQIGAEGGYVFDNGLGLNVGYRSASADIDGIEVTTNGFFAGLRYNF
ncbi:porin family protein [Agarivorans sp. DSG3-1]|uniref:porin family protein n=1 Tax=Agarivorans sp. DSG3-1 TaxID=3342249 RepID=UPI00398F1723